MVTLLSASSTDLCYEDRLRCHLMQYLPPVHSQGWAVLWRPFILLIFKAVDFLTLICFKSLRLQNVAPGSEMKYGTGNSDPQHCFLTLVFRSICDT